MRLLQEAEDETANLSGLRKTSETNVFNFVRLIVMRMVYGFASMFGLGDFLEDFAGGIFAPPTPDYGGLGLGLGLDYSDNDYKEYDDYDYWIILPAGEERMM